MSGALQLMEPKAVPGLPLIGNVLDMARDPAAFFLACYRQYGPVCRIRVLNNGYTLISGPEAAELLGTREGKDSLRSREFWEGMLGEFGASRALVSEDGPVHKQLRDVMRRGYSKEAARGRYDELVRMLDETLARDWKVGECVPVVQAMQYMAVDTLGALLTGTAPREYVKDIRTTILYILNVLVTRQRPRVLLLRPEYKRAKSRIFELGRKMVADALARAGRVGDAERNLVDDIVQAHVNDPSLIPEGDLLLLVTGPYVAGLDTVANTTGAIVYAILKHPEVHARVLREVDEYFASESVSEEGLLKSMPSLNGAIMETMRLYPIAVAQMRTATRDFAFQGYQIRQGEMIYLGTSVPHFMEEFYPRPLEFDIDRYAKGRAEHMQANAYSPYGRGPHTCLGKPLAEVQITLSMARLFHRLDLELERPDYVLKTKTAPTPGPAMSFKVRVKGLRVPQQRTGDRAAAA